MLTSLHKLGAFGLRILCQPCFAFFNSTLSHLLDEAQLLEVATRKEVR